MNDPRADDGRRSSRRVARKARLVIAAVALVGLGTAIGVVATELPTRAMWHGWKEWRHDGGSMSEAKARERTKRISAWILDEVDASEAQREQIDEVLDDLVTKAWPLREQHREHRQAFIDELTQPEVRREVLEELRGQELALADALSGDLLEALVAVSGILDVDQRRALAEHMARHRHYRHHHRHHRMKDDHHDEG